MEPRVPGWVEVMRGLESRQHCKTDFPDTAAETVMLRCLAAEVTWINRARATTSEEMKDEKEPISEHNVCAREDTCLPRKLGESYLSRTIWTISSREFGVERYIL